jgi:uncharacterized protein with PIN domain
MASLVFDACALIAFAYDEDGADLLETYLASEENTCFVHSLNFCEFYYQAIAGHRNMMPQEWFRNFWRQA